MAEDSKRYKKLAGNTAIIGIGQLGSKVLVYLLVRLYTTVMSGAEYSIASNITETATLLLPLISLSIGEAVFRFGMDKDISKKTVFTNGFAAFLMGSLLFAAVIPILCSIPYMQGREWLVVVYVIASTIHTICSQFLRAQGKFKLYAVQGLVNTALTIACNVIFLIPLKMSFVGYVLSVAVADILSSIFMIFMGRLWNYFDLRAIRKSVLWDMMKYSIPMIPASIFWWVTNVSDRYMVTYYLGDNVNGLYSASYKIPTLLMILSQIFINAWRHSAVDEKDSSDTAGFYQKVFGAFSSIVFILGSGIIAFCQVITIMMFAPGFHDAWIYIPILTLSMIFYDLVSFLGSLYVVEKKSMLSMLTAMAGAALNVALNFLLIPTKLGAIGAAIATAASYMFCFALRVWSAKKIKPFKMHMGRLVLNTLLLSAQVVVIMLAAPGWIWSNLVLVAMEALLLLAVMLINCKPLLDILQLLLGDRLSARKQKKS